MTTRRAHIVLIGLRCSGKSTLGAQLADGLGVPFVDLDDRVSDAAGADRAADVIEREGIDAFRAAETREVGRVLDEDPSVIALGGGTPTAPGAADLLTAAQRDGTARVFYLRALPETLRTRMEQTDTSARPALVGDDPLSEIASLFDERDPAYTEIAESIIETDGVEHASVLRALTALAAPDL